MKKKEIGDIVKLSIYLNILVFSFVFFINNYFVKMNLFQLLFKRKLFYLPLIVYILFFSISISFVIFNYLQFRENKQFVKIEKILKLLNRSEYTDPIFLKFDKHNIFFNSVIDKEFLRLHQKLIVMSEEATTIAKQTSAITKESKEEILEEERHRIGRELHDSVSQQLFAASMLLSTIKEISTNFSSELNEQIDIISNSINEAQSELRALLLHLRPLKLSGRTLKDGIEQLLTELKTKIPLKIVYKIEDIYLEEVIENHLFRIIQELTSNVLRHSKAKELEVYLKKVETYCQLNVIDDGVGFAMEKNKNKGLGLINIEERVLGLGGTFKIVSFEGEGTSVEIKIPIVKRGGLL